MTPTPKAPPEATPHAAEDSVQTAERHFGRLPVVQLLPLAGAVFCAVAALGFLADVARRGQAGVGGLALVTIVSGALASIYVVAALRRRYAWVGALLVLQILATYAAGTPLVAPPAPWAYWTRLALDVALAIAGLVAAHRLFLVFTGRQAASHERREREAVRLAGERERDETERTLAANVHAALAPAVALDAPWCTMAGRVSAGREVGGSLVEAFTVGRRPLGFVASVAGRGTAATTRLTLLKAALRTRLLTSGDPDTVLADMNEVLAAITPGDAGASVALAVFETATRVAYAQAAHDAIVHWRARDATVARLHAGGDALGARAGTRYRMAHVDVAPGDLLVLLAGGFPGSNGTRESAVPPAVARALAETGERPLVEVLDALLQEAGAHGAPGHERAALVIRVLPG